MILNYTKAKALQMIDHADLVRLAVRRGWMSYPQGTETDKHGCLKIQKEKPDIEYRKPRHTIETARIAYKLRNDGLQLIEISKRLCVPMGSLHYLISKGHEDYLITQRAISKGIIVKSNRLEGSQHRSNNR